MIDQLAADLLAKVASVPALAGVTSLSIGGRSQDPGLAKIPLPAAWLVFRKEASDEVSYEHGPQSGLINESQLMLATFAPTIFVPYVDDADLLATQYPLLLAVREAVHGKDSPSGFRWRYAGQRIALVYPDRLAYEQLYTVNYST